MNLKKGLFILFVINVFVLESCRKSDREKDTEVVSASDGTFAEGVFNDVFTQVHQIASDTNYINKIIHPTHMLATCPTITVSPALPNPAYPKTLTIDYGTTNCVGSDGVSRRGKIIAVFTGKYKTPGTKITFTLDSYYVNDNLVQATKTVVNNGKNSSGNLLFSINVSNASITTSDGTIKWKSSRVREWVDGDDTATLLDDIYSITGSAAVTGVKGNVSNISIKTALIVKPSCQWITKGVIELTPSNLSTRTIDFGEGSCDNDATLTLNGTTQSIELK